MYKMFRNMCKLYVWTMFNEKCKFKDAEKNFVLKFYFVALIYKIEAKTKLTFAIIRAY